MSQSHVVDRPRERASKVGDAQKAFATPKKIVLLEVGLVAIGMFCYIAMQVSQLIAR